MNSTSENVANDHHSHPLAVFPEKLTAAVAELKHRLQEHYERVHPGQTKLVRDAIAEAEALAWNLSFFPHLFLPDLVEARIAELALQPVRRGGGLCDCQSGARVEIGPLRQSLRPLGR